MIPTVEQIAEGIQKRLGDPNGRVFTTSDATEGYSEAYRHMRMKMLEKQIPRAKRVVTYRLPAGTTELSPATVGITNFGELITLEERTYGSTHRFEELEGPVERLDQRDAAQDLYEFEWREDMFVFVGSTEDRELRITYFESDDPPTSGSVGVDGSFLFLVNYGAGVIGPWKGYDEQADRCMMLAIGRDGHGGYLADLLGPMVRSLPAIQPAAYDIAKSGRRFRRAPYIAAPLPEGAMGIIGITGTQDGVNDTFTLSGAPSHLWLMKNGQKLKSGVAYNLSSNVVTFLPGYIPEADDILEAFAA